MNLCHVHKAQSLSVWVLSKVKIQYKRDVAIKATISNHYGAIPLMCGGMWLRGNKKARRSELLRVALHRGKRTPQQGNCSLVGGEIQRGFEGIAQGFEVGLPVGDVGLVLGCEGAFFVAVLAFVANLLKARLYPIVELGLCPDAPTAAERVGGRDDDDFFGLGVVAEGGVVDGDLLLPELPCEGNAAGGLHGGRFAA